MASSFKRFPEAVKALETAIRLQPDFGNAWINLGEAYFRQDQMGKAIVALEKSLVLVPTAIDARLYVIKCYGATNQFDKAQAHLDTLLTQSPEQPLVWTMQTAILLEQDKKREALSAFAKLKSLNPGMAKVLRERYLVRGKRYELPE